MVTRPPYGPARQVRVDRRYHSTTADPTGTTTADPTGTTTADPTEGAD